MLRCRLRGLGRRIATRPIARFNRNARSELSCRSRAQVRQGGLERPAAASSRSVAAWVESGGRGGGGGAECGGHSQDAGGVAPIESPVERPCAGIGFEGVQTIPARSQGAGGRSPAGAGCRCGPAPHSRVRKKSERRRRRFPRALPTRGEKMRIDTHSSSRDHGGSGMAAAACATSAAVRAFIPDQAERRSGVGGDASSGEAATPAVADGSHRCRQQSAETSSNQAENQSDAISPGGLPAEERRREQ